MFAPDLKNTKSLLLLSGGPDSVYLFYYLLELGASFDVVHFNHNLRGEESDNEESFVKKICHDHGVTCFIKHLQFENKEGMQNQARLKRYAYCFDLQNRENYHFIITAHHQDDIIETLVMRKKRGSGLKGLTGIRENTLLKNPLNKKKTFYLWRPLCGISKKTIEEKLARENHDYCVDSSNKERKYFRNRVRADLAPISDEKREQVRSLTSQLQNLDDYFQSRLNYLLKTHRAFIPSSIWERMPEELQYRYFRAKMKMNGYKKQVQRHHFLTSQSDEKVDLDGAIFFRDSSGCYFVSEESLKLEKERKFPINAEGAYYLSDWNRKILIKKKVVVGFEEGSLYYNSQKLKFPLYISGAALSEEMVPFGGKTPVPLKEIFQAHGIARFERLFWPVIRDSDLKIVGILGITSDPRYRVSEGEKTLIIS